MAVAVPQHPVRATHGRNAGLVRAAHGTHAVRVQTHPQHTEMAVSPRQQRGAVIESYVLDVMNGCTKACRPLPTARRGARGRRGSPAQAG